MIIVNRLLLLAMTPAFWAIQVLPVAAQPPAATPQTRPEQGPGAAGASRGRSVEGPKLLPISHGYGEEWGFVDRSGKIVIEPRFEAVGDVSEGRVRVRESGLWGFADETGRIIVPPQYEEAGDFAGSRARFRRTEKFGFIDADGKEVIPPRFDWAQDFAGGRAWVAAGGKTGCIDPAGVFLVEPQFDGVGPFAEGLAAFKDGGRFGYIDEAGARAIPARFEAARSFSGGLACVKQDGRWGYVDRAGAFAIPPRFAEPPGDFADGRLRIRQGQKWGYLDRTGAFAITPRFDGADDFSDGVARVRVGGRWGLVTPDGTWALEPRFDWIDAFADGLARVLDGGLWGYIDRTGKTVVEPQFDDTQSFSEDLAGVETEGRWGFLDRNGRVAIPIRFGFVEPFSRGTANVGSDRGYGFAYINASGAVLWNSELEKNLPPPVSIESRQRPVRPDPQTAKRDRFGDPLPPGAIARMGTTRLRHEDDAQCVAYSPDGTMVASGGQMSVSGETGEPSARNTLRLWDAATGEALLTFQAGNIGNLAFSPDGRFLAAGAEIRIWDLAAGRLHVNLKVYLHNGWSDDEQRIAFSPDSRLLAAAFTVYGMEIVSGVGVWEVESGRRIHTLKTVGPPAFSPDGTTLAIGQEGRVGLWNPATGEKRGDLETGLKTVRALVFFRDGRLLIGGTEPHRLSLWDVKARRELLAFEPAEHDFGDLALAPDERTAASTYSNDESVLLWDVETGKQLKSFDVDAHNIGGVAFSPDSSTLATANGFCGQAIQLWDVASGRERFADVHRSAVYAIAFSRNGALLATGGRDGAARIWEAATGKPLKSQFILDSDVFSVDFHPDGKSLIFRRYDETLRVWDFETDTERFRLGDPGDKREDRFRFDRAAFLDDGRIFAVARQGYASRGLVGFWREGAQDPLLRLPADAGGHYRATLAVSRDGRLVAAPRDGRILVWTIPPGLTGDPYAEGRGAALEALQIDVSQWQVGALLLSPDGRSLAARLNSKQQPPGPGLTQIWDIASGATLFRVEDKEAFLSPAAFTRDGRYLVMGGRDRVVRLWEIASRSEVLSLEGHGDGVWAVAASPTDWVIASASGDSTALVWDLSGGLLETVRRGPPPDAPGLQRAWADLAGADTAAAHRAMWTFAGLASHPSAEARAAATAFLRKHCPPAPADTEREARIAQTVADLDHDEFAAREAATAALPGLGPEAEGAVREAIEKGLSAPADARARAALSILLETGAPRGEELRRLRAVEAIERAGSPEARTLLGALAAGPRWAPETRAAREALKRMDNSTLK